MDTDLNQEIDVVRQLLLKRSETEPETVLRSVELKSLYERIASLDPGQRPAFGQAVNSLRSELSAVLQRHETKEQLLIPIDVTAPFDTNTQIKNRPGLLLAEQGSIHPLMRELAKINDIFVSMGFSIMESREIDDDWHMFTSLNFPKEHPARDDFDTFMTEQTNQDGQQFIAPAHTSTMQIRALQKYKDQLNNAQPIAVLIPGRVFRNEDVDPRHEHTFYQFEGVYVGSKISIGNLIATLQTFLESYYQMNLKVKTQPFYFPFTEPSLEFAVSCPFCQGNGCRICSDSGWIELLGCGMIHPNVLNNAGIDPSKFQGFAWGCGLERLVMMKYAIDEIRLFESGRLDFLQQFSSKGHA